MTKMSNWQIWCRAVVKTEEGPLLHFFAFVGLVCPATVCTQTIVKYLQRFCWRFLLNTFQKLQLPFCLFLHLMLIGVHPPVQQLLGICKKLLLSWQFFKNLILVTKKRRRRYTLFFHEEIGFMNALWDQNVQIRRKFEFSVKFVLPTSKSRKMCLLNVLFRDKIFW